MTSFKYLRRLLTMADDSCSEVIINLQKASRIWYCLSRILGREGSNPKTSGNLYLAVVQVILIFGLETWVVTPRIG